ncbi:MAG TPA: flavodoxin family protein [Methanocorpusculum sp.]|nr:flavodoxin family protein [Methanocorpusculum sp.]
MTNIIAINGSPRPHGNTDLIIDAFLMGASSCGASTKKINLHTLNYKNCMGCNSCHKTGQCVIQDDFTPIFTEILESDILILASPIYSTTVTADLKSFIDRGQFIWAQKFVTHTRQVSEDHLKKHIGVYIGTSGQNTQNVFDGAFAVVKAFFNNFGFKYTENVLFAGMDIHGGVNNWPESITQAKNDGKRIAQLL